MLKNIRIVLYKTIYPDNIGAAARAMKTMGLSDLYLVSPEKFPDSKAVDMASNAADVLENAVVVDNLAEAINHCEWVAAVDLFGQPVSETLKIKTPRVFAEKASRLNDKKIAVIFGNEKSVLTGDELAHCHVCIQIPRENVFLNLASAVQIVAYEFCIVYQSKMAQEWDYQIATPNQMKYFYKHVEKILRLLNPAEATQNLLQLQQVFDRVNVDELEMKMLRGILSAIEKRHHGL